eukprot:TRINITY_DN2439_c0_g1_i11.p1 TRINITY_DN2439_c0_g1~~TRINITY_DN2439_c0_g1_i11.p1  ORF type:complete len:246 (+),score=41.34 TRINITY_DN2439_c0_g1_i11:181-918(+)
MRLKFRIVRLLAGLVLCVSAMSAMSEQNKSPFLVYKDSSFSVSDRIEDLLSRMTLAEKIGQMTQIERSVATPEVIKHYGIGSILSSGGSVPAPNASASMWADMIDGFQEPAMSTRLGIPLIFGTDAVHGHNNLYGATIFPHNIGLGATRDPELVKKIGAITALEARASGVHYAFAPCVAVSYLIIEILIHFEGMRFFILQFIFYDFTVLLQNHTLSCEATETLPRSLSTTNPEPCKMFPVSFLEI